ncbi:hypothetical protein E2C01_083542 [Portunus trituberculatus]|uniref:Uncharacterized protein n=1 Tax=Portunus trituberculatus TaxID=210409 RepID=A0A5B7J3S8_PORTR|nr:hypothetical protein [Portunus trituberculatus]
MMGCDKTKHSIHHKGNKHPFPNTKHHSINFSKHRSRESEGVKGEPKSGEKSKEDSCVSKRSM